MLGCKALSQHVIDMCDSLASHRSLIIPAPTLNPEGGEQAPTGAAQEKPQRAPQGGDAQGGPDEADNKTEEDMNPYRLILYNTSADWDVGTPALSGRVYMKCLVMGLIGLGLCRD